MAASNIRNPQIPNEMINPLEIEDLKPFKSVLKQSTIKNSENLIDIKLKTKATKLDHYFDHCPQNFGHPLFSVEVDKSNKNFSHTYIFSATVYFFVFKFHWFAYILKNSNRQEFMKKYEKVKFSPWSRMLCESL